MPRTTSSATHNHAVGRELRQRREELGMTQAEVAGHLGVSQAYIQKVEAGRDNLTVGQLARLAEALSTNLRIHLEPRPAPDRILSGVLAGTRS